MITNKIPWYSGLADKYGLFVHRTFLVFIQNTLYVSRRLNATIGSLIVIILDVVVYVLHNVQLIELNIMVLKWMLYVLKMNDKLIRSLFFPETLSGNEKHRKRKTTLV